MNNIEQLLKDIESVTEEKIPRDRVTHSLPKTFKECEGTPYFYPFPEEGTFQHYLHVERGKVLHEYSERFGFQWLQQNSKRQQCIANEIRSSLTLPTRMVYTYLTIKNFIKDYIGFLKND